MSAREACRWDWMAGFATASSVSGGLPRQRRGPRRAPRAGAAVTAALAATAGLPVPALLAGAAGLPVPAVLAGAAGLPLAVRGAAGAVVPVIGFSFMPVAGTTPALRQ